MLDTYLRNGRIFLAIELFLPERVNGLGVVFPRGRGEARLFDDLHGFGFLANSGITVTPMEH